MNAIVFPLKLQDQGERVADLQDALQVAIDRGALLANDAAARRDLGALLKRERLRPTFADGTARLVAAFQTERRLPANGEVNDATAKALNAMLRDLGLLDPTPGRDPVPTPGRDPVPPALVKIDGALLTAQGQPADDIKLRLYRRNFGQAAATLLAEATTLADGRFAFTYDVAHARASLELRAVKNGAEVLLTQPLNNIADDGRSQLTIVAPKEIKPVDAEYKRLSTDLTAQIGAMANLAKATETDKQQDLTVLNRATGWDARLIALASLSERLAGDPDVGLSADVVYGLLRAGLPSDKRLLAHVDPATVTLALKKVRDAGIVDIPDQAIDRAKDSFATFAQKVRLNLPAPGSTATYGEFLKTSGLAGDAQQKFASVYLRHRGDGAQLWDEARKAGLDAPQIGKLQLQGKLAFLGSNGAAMTTQLLNKVKKDPAELVDQDFHTADRWQRELFDMAGVPDARRNNLTDEDRKKLAAIIPPTYEADTVETRMANYADDMARKIRLSYSTQVFARQLETDPAFKLPSNHDSTMKLLKGATAEGFRLGETSVSAFLSSGPSVVAGLSSAQVQSAGQQLKMLQRVYQITPDNETMPVLMQLNMTSAYDVMAYPESDFVELFKTKYREIHKRPAPSGVPELVSRKAQQVSSVTYNLFAVAKKLETEPPVAGLSAPIEARERVKNALIKQYPTLESLFGSMDFCECDHCRSVLSPAAYFVDLLQFVDTESAVWANFLTQWKNTHNNQDYPHKNAAGVAMKPYDVLTERRPDLAHIPLTCVNTHTALPYIDIVNEVLEYYVAHGALDKDAARDTGNATTAELLAEPQNVIREAYDAVRGAQYPLNLPFDLWAESTRQFCEYCDTPLPRLLETFRTKDDLFAPAEPFDRAAIFLESLQMSPAEAALFTDPDPLTGDRWHALYGYPSIREAIQAPTNAGNATLSLANAGAAKVRAGLAYSYFDTSANAVSNEQKIVSTVSAANSAGAGRATITFEGTWTTPPVAGDLLVCDAPAMLKSAKALSRRLGVTYKQIAEIVQTGFVNPELNKLSLLYTLGVSVADARFYLANKPLLAQNPATLSVDDQKRRLEVEAFQNALRQAATTFNVTEAQLDAAIQAMPFNRVVLLADPDAGCDFDLTTLRYSDGTKADAIVFLRINLFVRLWRKLGWTIEETDRALQVLVPKNAPFETAQLAKKPLLSALIHVAHLQALDQRLAVGKQSRIKLLTLWSDIPTTGKKSLYAQLFLTRSVLKSAPVFDHPLGNYLTTPNVKIKTYALAVQGALGLTADDISRILVNANATFDTADLTLPNVSLLYRYGLLAKALKLSVRELIALQQLSGIDPFTPLHAEPLATLDQDHPFQETLEFVTLAEEVKASGLSIDDLDYLLRHRFDDTGKYRVNRDAVLTTLTALSDGIRAIQADHAVPDDPSILTDELLAQKLGLVLPADVVTTFLSMINGTAEFTATKTGVIAANQLPAAGFAAETVIREVPYNAVRQEQKLTFHGVLFDAEKNALTARLPKPAAGNPHVPSPLLAELLDDVQRQARRFFDLNLLKQPAGMQPASGFLDAADYDLMFAPVPAGATEAQQRALDRQRRTRLAQAFLPFLQQRLIRQFIIQAITAQTGGDPALVESFVTDERMLSLPGPVSAAFVATANRVLTATFWPTADATGAPSSTVSLIDGNIGQPAKPVGTNSAQLEGYLEVPATGAYRFLIELDQQNAEATLQFPHLLTPVFVKGAAAAANDTLGDQAAEFLELKAGVPYRFQLNLTKLNGGNARLLVQGETVAKGSLSQLTLYPAGGLDASERAMTLLGKALQLSTSLALSEREMRYILTHAADFGGATISDLPTTPVGNTAAEQTSTRQRFTRFRRLAAYARLKAALAAGTDDLIGIFESNGTTAAERLVKQVYPRLAKLTRRDETTVKDTAEALVKAPGVPTFESERPLWRLWDGLQVVERFGVRPAALIDWTRVVNPATTSDDRFSIARDVKESIKARFEPDAWQRVAQPIFDKLRQRQRDALVSYVLQQLGFDRLEQLYEYFLIDPGMEPVVQTSRIRLAIAALQLFVQRCLLNLEPKVHPSTINARYWEWMKRYRVWEASRKIFLFPENWLEPEFRDDKTHLFAELEGALMQSDVSTDVVEDAFLNYLRKLDELARLDIVAMHIEDNADPSLRTLHVFGRTYGEPHKYFYRRYARQMWTPWEPVGAEVSGDHLAPVMWRNRLYLFWVTFIEKVPPPPATSVDPTKTIALPAIASKIEAQLHWSEYVQGEWSTRASGSFDPPDAHKLEAIAVKPRQIFVWVSKEYDEGEERGVKIHLSWPFNMAFYLAGRNATPERISVGSMPGHPYTPTYDAQTVDATRYTGSGPFKVSYAATITTKDTGFSTTPATPNILSQGSAFNLVPCDNDLTSFGIPDDAYKDAANPDAVKAALERGLQGLAALAKPVFYQDRRYTLFVEPDVTERTIEEWQEWVTRTPVTEPELTDPKWWQDIPVSPKFPWKFPGPPPEDPRINPGSIVKPGRTLDWLVNPAAVVKFDDAVVGPVGQPGIEILTDVRAGLSDMPVNVHTGSNVAGLPTAVVRDGDAFARSGLQTNGTSLNVVGGGGFNAAMGVHLQDLMARNLSRTGRMS